MFSTSKRLMLHYITQNQKQNPLGQEVIKHVEKNSNKVNKKKKDEIKDNE